MVDTEQVRRVAMSLPRTTEHLIRDRVKFRVKQLVYVALSRDERSMGLAFPKEEREALVGSEPDKFFLPVPSDLRYHWVCVWLDALDQDEMRELVEDAWRMVVPKGVASSWLEGADRVSPGAGGSSTDGSPAGCRRDGHGPCADT